MGSGGTVPLIPYAEIDEYECSTWQPRDCVTENVPVPTEQQARWSPELGWTFWRKSLWNASDSLVVQSVA